MKFNTYFEVSEDLSEQPEKKVAKVHLETLSEDEAKGFVKKFFENTGDILKINEISRDGNFIKFGADKLPELPPAPKGSLIFTNEPEASTSES